MTVGEAIGAKDSSFQPVGAVHLQGRNLKELTEGYHQAWILRLNSTQREKPYWVQTTKGLTESTALSRSV